MNPHVLSELKRHNLSLWDPIQGTSLSCTQSRMISLRQWFLPKPPKVPPLAFKSQRLIPRRLCYLLSEHARYTRASVNVNRMERAGNTREVVGLRVGRSARVAPVHAHGTRAQSAQPERSRMRRVHFPFKFIAPLQPCSSCARRPGGLRVAYSRGQRSISTKPDRDTARTIFSGIQPTGIPHVRFILARKLCVAF
jgi:hypothetical protein